MLVLLVAQQYAYPEVCEVPDILQLSMCVRGKKRPLAGDVKVQCDLNSKTGIRRDKGDRDGVSGERQTRQSACESVSVKSL